MCAEMRCWVIMLTSLVSSSWIHSKKKRTCVHLRALCTNFLVVPTMSVGWHSQRAITAASMAPLRDWEWLLDCGVLKLNNSCLSSWVIWEWCVFNEITFSERCSSKLLRSLIFKFRRSVASTIASAIVHSSTINATIAAWVFNSVLRQHWTGFTVYFFIKLSGFSISHAANQNSNQIYDSTIRRPRCLSLEECVCTFCLPLFISSLQKIFLLYITGGNYLNRRQ